jgi:serine/threonine protein kinase/WD40 repeat protein
MPSMEPLESGDPAQVGAYRLVGRLGAGGMGQVYLGVSRGGRKVAVKVLRADLVADAEFRARFAREVAAARTVNGFYTAPVVDADPGASPPWMVTAYVQGPSLAAAVAQRGPLPEPEVRDLAAALAEGLAAIHACGLVHRDLKPANIILADDGPRIIDFGIARAVGTSTMTAQGTIIGTFTYMSPEQVMGSPVGSQSDVFSLGSVLVFAATGHGPFDAETLPAITHRIFSQPPDLAGLPGSLSDLVTGCLDKDPAKRPSLDDLLTRLADPVPGPGHPGTVLAAPASAPVWQMAPVPGPAPVPASQPAAFLAPQALLLAPGTQTFSAAAPLAYPSNPPLPSLLLGADGWNVTEVAFSPDGRLVAASASEGTFWRVFLWDTLTRQLASAPFDAPGRTPPRMAFSPDGRLLVLKEPGSTRALSLVTGQFVSLPGSAREHSWRKVRFSPDGRLLATVREVRRVTGFTGAQVRLWDSATLQPASSPVKLDYYADDSTLAFSPDNRYLFFGHDSQVFLGDVSASQLVLRKLKDLRGAPGMASFSGDGRMLAVRCAEGNAVRVLDTASQTPVATLNCNMELAWIAFSPAWPLVATAMVSGGGEAIDLWNLTAPAAAQSWPTPSQGRYLASPAVLSGFRRPVSEMRFSPDGAYLAAASRARPQDGQALLQVWSASSAQPGSPLSLPGPARITFSPDSRFLAASCADRAVRLISMQGASAVSVLSGSNATFSPSAEFLATTESAGLRLWTLPR